MNPKASSGVLCPPLRGIVQLTNFPTLRYGNRSFTSISDIVHYFQGGSPLTYIILHPDGRLEKKILGADLSAGQQLQLIVRGGSWKATELIAGEFGLVSEAVSPGFQYEDMELAEEKAIKNLFPHLWDQICRYVKD